MKNRVVVDMNIFSTRGDSLENANTEWLYKNAGVLRDRGMGEVN